MNAIKNLANWKIITPLSLLFGVFAFYLFPKHGKKINDLVDEEIVILDARSSYTANDVETLFELLGTQGREIYGFISGRIDMIYPIVYGLLFFLIIINLGKRLQNSKWLLLSIVPIIALLFDYIENISIQNLLKNYPNIIESKVVFASNMTSGKWIFVSLSLLTIIALSFITLISTLKKRNVSE